MAEQTPKLGDGQTPDFVRLVIDKERRYKLRFKHAQLRNAVHASGNRSIGELLGDSFGGWPYLLAEGHRPFNRAVTLDHASEWIDAFCTSPDPATGKSRDMGDLQALLSEALTRSGFLKITVDEDKDEAPEGNEPAEANDD